MSRPRPAWCASVSEVSDLADWLVDSEQWDNLDDKEKLSELLHFLDKPWNYDNEWQLMRHKAFRCCDCDAFTECASETQAERAEDGADQRCPDCDDSRRAEAAQ